MHVCVHHDVCTVRVFLCVARIRIAGSFHSDELRACLSRYTVVQAFMNTFLVL